MKEPSVLVLAPGPSSPFQTSHTPAKAKGLVMGRMCIGRFFFSPTSCHSYQPVAGTKQRRLAKVHDTWAPCESSPRER
jgi:hypothetical protein